AGGVLLWVLGGLTDPLAVFLATLAFWLTMGPASTLATALSFAHLPAPEHDFGRVRLCGTLGWVCSGWLVGYWLSSPAWLRGGAGWLSPGAAPGARGDAFRLAGVVALALSAYALTLPHTPPQRRLGSWLAPLAALRLFRGRAFAVYAVC